MSNRPRVRLALIVAALLLSMSQAYAQSSKRDTVVEKMSRRVTQAEREAAAQRFKATRAKARQSGQIGLLATEAAADPVVGQGDVPDYFGATPNWNYTPPLRKFVDRLPLLGLGGANLLGQYLPIAVPDRNAYPGIDPGVNADYYEIAVVQYEEKLHSDLPPTTLRGYVQIDTPAIPNTPTRFALTYPDGSPIRDAGGNQVFAVDKPHYLGPIILAQRDVPVRIKFYNYLPKGVEGDLFIPVDPSVMGAGMGPRMLMAHMAMAMGTTATIMTMEPHGLQVGDKVMLHGFEPKAYDGFFTITGVPSASQFRIKLATNPGGDATVLGDVMECYTENRAVVHLHGGRTPWISDGTPHQWLTPADEDTSYPQGDSVEPVPDMDDDGNPRDGVMSYYYTNQQSARLMFYHDHVYGITRLNVYAGEAAGYVIRDDVEQALVNAGFIPVDEIPLIIQDKTFVDADTVGELDPTWRWGTGADGNGNGYPDYKTGDLWVPHVYMPAQNPYDISGMAAMGRWHYGPWFWPPTVNIGHPPIDNPYYDPINRPWQPPEIPDVPDPSMGMEAFNDTPLVNGTCYPTITLDPKAYRFRVLVAANDRFFNLQLYEADPAIDIPGVGLTEVKMVPASMCNVDPNWPQDFTEGNPTWPVDGREGGVPDWNTRGPDWIQIGTEGGFLPMPVVVPQRPVDWNVDVTTFDAGIVNSHSLLLGPAERADVIVDFSAYAGKTLILYNDAPAAFPAPDPRYDYYTGMPDLTDIGGRYPTDPGLGPNTRTIMQIKVNPDPVASNWQGLDALRDKWRSTESQNGVFVQAQDPIIVAQGEVMEGYTQYNEAYDATFPDRWPNWGIGRIHDTSLRFQTIEGTTVTIPMERKAIQDEMGETFDDYGRMAGKLGLQLPNPIAGGQTFVLKMYTDPSTENITVSATPLTPPLAGDGTQIWKITHNGVDVHPIHFHLFDVQLINRVAWDNNVRMPDATEMGWKDTIRVNPLQDTVVALRPVIPVLPFKLPDSVRLLDPTMPEGVTWQSFDPVTAEPYTVTNTYTNFGWEYMWHCHILSHEEMEMMRPIVVKVAPDAPSGLTAEIGGSVHLAWVNNATFPAATNIVIQRANDAVFTQGLTTFNVADPLATSFVDNSAEPATTYYYSVRAENALAYSPWSNTASVNGPGSQAPAAPSDLMAMAMSPNMVDLAWTDNADDETGFRIERAIGAGAFALLAIVSENVTSYMDMDAQPNTEYSYRVLASNATGDSIWSNTATATTPATVPARPTNLGATVIAPREVSLTWSDNSNNETGFRVERAVGAGAFEVIGNLGADATSFSDTTPPDRSTVYYRVYAFNAVGSSPASNIANAVLPLADPTGLAAAVSPTAPLAIVLTWTDNSVKETGYVVQRATNASFNAPVSTYNLGPDVTTFNNTTIIPNTLYYYRVRGSNGAVWSNVVSIQAATPAAPSNLRSTQVLPASVSIAWNDNSNNETGFRVERAVGTGAFSAIATLAANATTFDDATAPQGIALKYRVIAFNVAGNSPASNLLSVTIPLARPTGLTATLAGPRQVDLAWVDNSTDETGFRVERAVGAGAFTLIATLGANVTSYSDTTPPDRSTVYYRVFSLSGSAMSSASNMANAVIPIADPTGLAASVSAQPPLSIVLTWTDNSVSETGYVVQRARDANFVVSVSTYNLGANVTTFDNTTVLANTTYFYRVRAANGTVWSNVVTASATPPAAPTSLGTTQALPTSVSIAWNDNSNNEGVFTIQRSTTSNFIGTVVSVNVPANTTTYTATGLNQASRYYFRVRAINGAGNSAWSNTLQVPPR